MDPHPGRYLDGASVSTHTITREQLDQARRSSDACLDYLRGAMATASPVESLILLPLIEHAAEVDVRIHALFCAIYEVQP